MPPEYVEFTLARELGIGPKSLDDLSARKMLEFMACIKGENKAQRIQRNESSNAGPFGALQNNVRVRP